MARKCTRKSCRKELPTKAKSDKWQVRGFCNVDCMAGHGNDKAVAARERAQATERRKAREARAAERKAYNDDKRARKEALKTKRDYMKEAQSAWNSYVRARDNGKCCASCGAMPEQKFGGTMDCSHYRSVGAAAHLRFNLHNAASACVKCNRHLSGNIVELRKGLIDRIGVEKVEALEANNTPRKFDIEYLKRIKKIFNKKTMLRKKRYNID